MDPVASNTWRKWSASAPWVMLLAGWLVSPPAPAATLEGRVSTLAGQPVPGAMVTLWNAEKNRKETVYSDAHGKYRLATHFTGDLLLRARSYNYRDFNLPVRLQNAGGQTHALVLEPLTDAQEISDALTASAHAAVLPFPDQKTKDTFIAQCSYCHQQGNSLTRRARSASEWNDVIWRMEGYGALLTFADAALGYALWDATDRAPCVTVSQQSQFIAAASNGRKETGP